jgi:hypothetical protein
MTEREFQALHQRTLAQFELAYQACQYLERHCGASVGDLALKVWRAIDEACAGLLRQGEPGFEAVEALKEEASRKACRALGAQVVLADGDFLAQKLFQTAEDALMAFAAGLVEMRCAVEYAEDEVEADFEVGEPFVQFAQMVDQPAMERVEL